MKSLLISAWRRCPKDQRHVYCISMAFCLLNSIFILVICGRYYPQTVDSAPIIIIMSFVIENDKESDAGTVYIYSFKQVLDQ